MQINKITDAFIHFGKAIFAATVDLLSVPILTSIYQAANSENNNTDENRERTIQFQKLRNALSENELFKAHLMIKIECKL